MSKCIVEVETRKTVKPGHAPVKNVRFVTKKGVEVICTGVIRKTGAEHYLECQMPDGKTEFLAKRNLKRIGFQRRPKALRTPQMEKLRAILAC